MSEMQTISTQHTARIDGNVQLAANALRNGQLTSSVQDYHIQPGTIEVFIILIHELFLI